MGKHGPSIETPFGRAQVALKGYAMVGRAAGRPARMLHALVWEATHGPIPSGMQLHHLNHGKLDNRLENLALVDPTTHKREHSDCVLIDGVWWKLCEKCGDRKPESEFYHYEAHNGLYYKYKPCASREAVESKRARRARGAA